VNRVFENARVYNMPKSEIYNDAVALQVRRLRPRERPAATRPHLLLFDRMRPSGRPTCRLQKLFRQFMKDARQQLEKSDGAGAAEVRCRDRFGCCNSVTPTKCELRRAARGAPLAVLQSHAAEREYVDSAEIKGEVYKPGR